MYQKSQCAKSTESISRGNNRKLRIQCHKKHKQRNNARHRKENLYIADTAGSYMSQEGDQPMVRVVQGVGERITLSKCDQANRHVSNDG